MRDAIPRQPSSPISQTFARQNQFVLPFTRKTDPFEPNARPNFFVDVRYILAISPLVDDEDEGTVIGSALLLDREQIRSDVCTSGTWDNGSALDVHETPLQIASMMGLSFPPPHSQRFLRMRLWRLMTV